MVTRLSLNKRTKATFQGRIVERDYVRRDDNLRYTIYGISTKQGLLHGAWIGDHFSPTLDDRVEVCLNLSRPVGTFSVSYLHKSRDGSRRMSEKTLTCYTIESCNVLEAYS